ncbi:MAG TPA: hypothetical protein VK488_03310 [Gaiellaceae bacterium]|nr:hypothetical protein [Gaiellaceae bacterium]
MIVGLVALLATGCGSGSSSGGSGAVTVNLTEQNGSGESGTATLTKEGDKTKVVLALQDNSATMMSEPQPAHIHKGSCAKLDPTPLYGLADVKNGKSTSTVNAKLDDLRNGAFAINVHKSATEIQTYVACGDIGTGKSSGGGGGGNGY